MPYPDSNDIVPIPKPEEPPPQDLSIRHRASKLRLRTLLCAAHLLTRLVQKVLPVLDMEFREIVLWCESTIVLAWINKPLNQLQSFGRNRNAVIQKQTDIVSWWSGPEFLQRERYNIELPENVPDQMLPALKAVIVNPDDPVDLKKKQPLIIPQPHQATETITQVVQFVHLADDIQRVVAHDPCKKLANLHPIYTDGLEALYDLSTDAFLAFFKRFIGRRGMVQQQHSDNGTIFQSTHPEITLLHRKKNLRTMPIIRETLVVPLPSKNQPHWKLGRITTVAGSSRYRRPISNSRQSLLIVELPQPGEYVPSPPKVN